MKVNMTKIYQKTGLEMLAILVVLIGMAWTSYHYKFWKPANKIIVWDVIGYYQYLPSTFIYKDPSMCYADKDPEFFKDKLYRTRTDNGRYVSKMSMGLAVLYSPFFFAANALAETAGYPADGYSLPYRLALSLGAIVYAILGLFFLSGFLRKYFARGIVALTVLAIGLGTNLYFYSTMEPGMSHAYNFFLFSVFIYLTDRWILRQTWSDTVLIGLISGLIILARPSNGVLVLLLPLWMVESKPALKNRIDMLLKNYMKIASMAVLVFMVFLPQLIYWKYTTGKFWYYSYGDEGFFFNDPEIIKGLLSYRKGLLVYTPIMTFALLGIIVLYHRRKELFWPVFAFTMVNLYIVFSWWCWWYGGSFGQRALIESYAVLAIPFAAFAEYIFNRKRALQIVFLVLVAGFISLNIFQTRQYYIGIIHWDSMSKYNYWDTFFRTKVSPAMYNHLDKPDYKAALEGKR